MKTVALLFLTTWNWHVLWGPLNCSSINTAAVLCLWFEPLWIVCRVVTMVLWYSVTPPGYDHGGGDLKAGSRSGRWSWHPHSLVGCMAIPTILKYLCTSKDSFAWLSPAPLVCHSPRFFFDTFTIFYLFILWICVYCVCTRRFCWYVFIYYIGFFLNLHISRLPDPFLISYVLHFT